MEFNITVLWNQKKEKFPSSLWVFYSEQNAINRLIFTSSHKKNRLQRWTFCDLLESFTWSEDYNQQKLSSLQSLVRISCVNVREKWAGLVLCITTSSCCAAFFESSIHPSIWKNTSVVPVCAVSAGFLHSLAWTQWDFLFSLQESPEVSYFLVTCSDPLAGQGYFFKGVLQTFSVAGRSNFLVSVPGNFILEATKKKKVAQWH